MTPTRQALLIVVTFTLGIGSTLAFQKAEPVVSANLQAATSDRPPIKAPPVQRISLDQLRANNQCQTFERFGIGMPPVTAPATRN